MSQISEKISSLMKESMKAKDTLTLNTVRALKAAMTNASIEKGSLSTLLDEPEELAVIRKQIKQREDSAEQFRKAGREDLLVKEEAEMKVLVQFLPAPLSNEEAITILDAVIAEIGATSKKDMGKVMKMMQERTEGRVNGKWLAGMVSSRLS
ncbi:MAG: GatB/YqeY domain-containing protein [Akkermansia sp.]